MGIGATQGIITVVDTTETLIESSSATYRAPNLQLASEVSFFVQSDASNPGESRVTVYTGYSSLSVSEYIELDVFDGLTTPADFDQGDAFLLEFSAQAGFTRQVRKYDADGTPGSKWSNTTETNAVRLIEFLSFFVETDSNVGNYAHTIKVLVKQ